MNNLPTELIGQILHFLPGKDAARFRHVSKRFASIINEYRILEHNLFVISWANSAGGATNRIAVYIDSPFFKCEVDNDHVYNEHDYGCPVEKICPGEHPITNTFYCPDISNGGEEFLRKILPLSRIDNIGMHYGLKDNEYALRFLELVSEARCPITQWIGYSTSQVIEVLYWLKKVQFHDRQNVHFYFLLEFPKMSDCWIELQELASISNFKMSLAVLMFPKLVQNIIENWLTGTLKHSFTIALKEEDDSLLLQLGFEKSFVLPPGIFFEGVALKDLKEVKSIADLPNEFRVAKPANKCFLTFTRQASGSPNFTVNFHN